MRRALRCLAAVALVIAAASLGQAAAHSAIPICASGKRVTCVVDGDTVWVKGVKYRFEEIDTPEKGALAECRRGCRRFRLLSAWRKSFPRESSRIKSSGKDRYGRVLARFMVGKKSAREMLVAEGLARPWRGQTEDWCK